MHGLFNFFKTVSKKKIIILGLTNITDELCTLFPWEISYFIDVDQKYVGQTLFDKPILPPDALINENHDSIAVIISGSYNIFVEESLKSLGLKPNESFWFGANLIEWFYYHKSLCQPQPVHMQIIMMDGGLASQLNKFAIGRLLESQLHVKVKYDLSWFENCGMDVQNKERRLFALTKVFNVKIDAATEEEIKSYKAFYYYNHGKVYRYDEELLQNSCNRYIDGYLANYQYFFLRGKELENELIFKMPLNKKNKEFKKQIDTSCISIAIHVRRGDYVDSVHEVVDSDYYHRAVKEMVDRIGQDNIHFFIFSNDMQWVRDSLFLEYPVTYVDCNGNDDGGLDMYLMSRCKHFILSNSGFGFWAAFLGRNGEKIVITPEKWFNINSPKMNERLQALIEGHDSGAAIPPNWLSIPV